MPGPPELVRSADDLEPLGWIVAALDRFGKLLPDGYPAYGRILHPAEELRGSTWVAVPWRLVAERTGRVLHPLVQFGSIVTPAAGVAMPWEGQQPWIGMLADAQLRALTPLLAAATTTPDACWFCIWDGYGEVGGAASAGVPRLALPGREYLVLRGPVAAAAAVDAVAAPNGNRVGPNLWWPEDRAWVVASEIDLDSTYVAGSRELIDAILAAPALEALETTAGAPITFDSDTINL